MTTQAKILELLLELKEDFDLTILMISHDVRCVQRTCSRIGILHRGELVGVYRREDLQRADHAYVRDLFAACSES